MCRKEFVEFTNTETHGMKANSDSMAQSVRQEKKKKEVRPKFSKVSKNIADWTMHSVL